MLALVSTVLISTTMRGQFQATYILTYLGSNSKSNIHRASHLLLSFLHETAMVNVDVVARYSYFRVT